MAEQRIRKRAGSWGPPNANQEIRTLTGTKVWHGVQPQRSAAMLPDRVKGPIRGRDARRAKGIPPGKTGVGERTRPETPAS